MGSNSEEEESIIKSDTFAIAKLDDNYNKSNSEEFNTAKINNLIIHQKILRILSALILFSSIVCSPNIAEPMYYTLYT